MAHLQHIISRDKKNTFLNRKKTCRKSKQHCKDLFLSYKLSIPWLVSGPLRRCVLLAAREADSILSPPTQTG